MTESHRAFLSLGSNIQPAQHIVKAIELLQKQGSMEKISSVWESKSVGAPGPNYLNACVSFVTALDSTQLKSQVLSPIELHLGRRRTGNKFAPRTMDIDIILFDDTLCDQKYWEQAFVMIPLAEIYPGYKHPLTQESVAETAARLRRDFWMEARPEVLKQISGKNRAA